MVKISALPPMTTPDGDDEAPIVDDSTAATKKFTLTLLKEWLQSLSGWISTTMLAASAITNAKLNLEPTVDANGWSVFDFGGYKEYRKKVTFSESFTSGSAKNISESSTNLPVDLSDLTGCFFNYSTRLAGFAGELLVNAQMGDASTGLGFVGRSTNTTTFTGVIDVIIIKET